MDSYMGNLNVTLETTPTPTPTPTTAAVFDLFVACKNPDCHYTTTEDILIAANRVKNIGDYSGTINIKFEELDAAGNPLSDGVACSGSVSGVSAGECIFLHYIEETGFCTVDLADNRTGYVTLNPRPAGTYYFGIKTWIDGEIEPSYPVPDSPDQPANAKAWSIVCELPTPTPTPTPTRPPQITGECVFPRLITGTLMPRLDKGVIFYRIRCIIDKWSSAIHI